MESVRYSMVLLLMIVNGIHSQQDTTSDVMTSLKDMQQNIKHLKEIVEANNINLNKQKDDILQIKDTIGNLTKSIIEMKNHSEKQQEDFSKNKDTVKDISQSTKNMSDVLEIICQNPGVLCIWPKRYILSTDQATPLQALQKCQEKNMTLASIDSEEEYNTLNAYLQSVARILGYWTSGIRKDASSEFYWKSSGKSLSYTKWYPGEPDSNNNCILIWKYHDNAVISAYPCTSRHRYVCEYRE